MTFLVTVWRIPCFLSSCCLAVRHALILMRPIANQMTFSVIATIIYIYIWFVVSVFYRFQNQRAEESLQALWCSLWHWDKLKKWKKILMTNIKYCWELNERIIDQNWIVVRWVCYTIRTNLKQAQSCLFILNVQKIIRITEPQNFRGQLLHAESDVQTKGVTKHYYNVWSQNKK